MVKVYLVRHTEADGNVKEYFQGRIDSEVSEKGLLQLNALAERFREIKLDAIYSSPLKRAMATAEAVNRHHGLEIIPDGRLVEINGGVWENVSWKDIPLLYPVEYDLWKNHQDRFYIKDGERMTEVFERMKNAVNDIAARNDGKTIAIVSHGCSLKNYLCYASGITLDKLESIGWSDNTAVSLLEFDGSELPKIIYKNDNSHLAGELSTLACSQWCKK